MASYVVTGASRGLGFAFIDHLSKDSSNTVIAFVRDEEKTRVQVEEKLTGRNNLHIIRGDLDDYESLKDAFRRTSDITGGSLDYLIANGGVSGSGLESLTELGTNPEALEKDLVGAFRTNLVGNVNLINLAIPLLEKGTVKKVIVLTTGLADIDLTRNYDLFESPSYSISKVAVDMMVAKYHAEHNSRGLLFMAISPGVVATRDPAALVEGFSGGEGEKRLGAFFGKFGKYAPHFAGPITADESVDHMLSVVNKATVQDFGGKAVSHLGTRQWL